MGWDGMGWDGMGWDGDGMARGVEDFPRDLAEHERLAISAPHSDRLHPSSSVGRRRHLRPMLHSWD
jgi:hypothetical protein